MDPLYKTYKGMRRCPYNSSHVVGVRHFIRHLLNCEKRSRLKLLVCPWNASHHVRPEHYVNHVCTCETQGYLDFLELNPYRHYTWASPAGLGIPMGRKPGDRSIPPGRPAVLRKVGGGAPKTFEAVEYSEEYKDLLNSQKFMGQPLGTHDFALANPVIHNGDNSQANIHFGIASGGMPTTFEPVEFSNECEDRVLMGQPLDAQEIAFGNPLMGNDDNFQLSHCGDYNYRRDVSDQGSSVQSGGRCDHLSSSEGVDNQWLDSRDHSVNKCDANGYTAGHEYFPVCQQLEAYKVQETKEQELVVAGQFDDATTLSIEMSNLTVDTGTKKVHKKSWENAYCYAGSSKCSSSDSLGTSPMSNGATSRIHPVSKDVKTIKVSSRGRGRGGLQDDKYLFAPEPLFDELFKQLPVPVSSATAVVSTTTDCSSKLDVCASYDKTEKSSLLKNVIDDCKEKEDLLHPNQGEDLSPPVQDLSIPRNDDLSLSVTTLTQESKDNV